MRRSSPLLASLLVTLLSPLAQAAPQLQAWLEQQPLQLRWHSEAGQRYSSEPHPALLEHWRILGQFRAHHPAIGAGSHQRLSSQPYAFARRLGDDKVVIVQGP